jgi:glycosyltransferase 2 family protein
MNYKKAFNITLSLLIILAVSVFFTRELHKSWTNILSYELKLDPYYLLLSFFAIIASYLLTTYAWHVTLNALSQGNKINFAKSVATVNMSNLTKYVPGKIWSYALQMYWLVKVGFSKSLILYVNLINLIIALITATILGVAYLLISPTGFPRSVVLAFFIALMILDILFIWFNSTLFKGFVFTINRLFKRNIQYFDVSKKLLLIIHVVHLLSAFCFGIGAYLICLGMGFSVEKSEIWLVMSSLMISDVVGFLAIIVPGGLGVREWLMYAILSRLPSSAIPLILPLAARIVTMLADILLGAVGFLSSKRMTDKK